MRRSVLKLIPVFLLILGMLVSAAGCGQKKESPGPAQEERPATMQVTVYYVKMTDADTYLVREIHTVPYTTQTAQAALEELISGTPTTEGAFRVLPADTTIPAGKPLVSKA